MISQKTEKIILFFLICYSIYCALIIGESWDEEYNLTHGRATLNYLFSLGKINENVHYGNYYSSSFWSLQYFLKQIFPQKYHVEIVHLINLCFSFGVAFGIGNLCKVLFNKKVGKIVFLILIFYPIFFGHMSMNGKDTILAFCHVWIFYLILRYLKKQHITSKVNYYISLIAILAAIASGIQLVFLGSLLTIFLFVIIDVFLLKKFSNYNFNKRKFFFHAFKSFLIFYFILILFWKEVHPNIFTLPFNFFLENILGDNWRGWPYTLLNEKYYFSFHIPKLYIIINLIFKSPEYFLLSYIIFIFIILKSNKFYKNQFNFFYYKLVLIFSVIALPNLILFIVPFPAYDGMRLFLWSVPYFCIIPALVIYFLMENYKLLIVKITLLLLLVLASYSLFNFFSITPYQYSYLNILNTQNGYQKFENDYWGVSIKELIKKSNFLKEGGKLALCGVNKSVIENYLKKNKFSKVKIVNTNENYNFIIMTNRTIWNDDILSWNIEDSNKITNCFDKFKGTNLSEVKRNNLLLSAIRKK